MKRKRPPKAAPDLWRREREFWSGGLRRVAGLDEAGRGPLAGPVVAAAVVLPPGFSDPRINDSKLIPPVLREELAGLIAATALGWAVAEVEAAEIDRINILQATHQAMRLAVARLPERPEFLLVDALTVDGIELPQEGIIRGDRLCGSIAAASILAKVHRDRLMDGYHERYPKYGFDRHRGYGTAAHLRALRAHGPCPIHRLTFNGVG